MSYKASIYTTVRLLFTGAAGFEPATCGFGDQETVPKITFQDLKMVLAVLARDGKQEKVKELITKYGATKLSEVPEEHYHELLEEARKI